MTCLLNKYEWTTVFVDLHLDPILSATFDRKLSPQLFVMWNETQKVYAWDYKESFNDTFEWILEHRFVNSTLQFDSMRVLPW